MSSSSATPSDPVPLKLEDLTPGTTYAVLDKTNFKKYGNDKELIRKNGTNLTFMGGGGEPFTIKFDEYLFFNDGLYIHT